MSGTRQISQQTVIGLVVLDVSARASTALARGTQRRCLAEKGARLKLIDISNSRHAQGTAAADEVRYVSLLSNLAHVDKATAQKGKACKAIMESVRIQPCMCSQPLPALSALHVTYLGRVVMQSNVGCSNKNYIPLRTAYMGSEFGTPNIIRQSSRADAWRSLSRSREHKHSKWWYLNCRTGFVQMAS